MDYTLQFGQVTGFVPYLLWGAALSVVITFVAYGGGMLLGLLLAMAKSSKRKVPAALANAYIVFFMNTPGLVDIYFIYYACPNVGLDLSPLQAVLIGLTLKAAAYLAEIQRAGFVSVHVSEVEAAETLGMSRWQIVRYIVIPHVIKVVFPPLSNHFVHLMLATSLAAIFGVEELTGRAFNLESRTFRPIEIFSIVAVMYVGMTLVATAVLVAVGRYLFRVRMRVI